MAAKYGAKYKPRSHNATIQVAVVKLPTASRQNVLIEVNGMVWRTHAAT